MPSTREIRRRIKSVTNIGQITKATELVAASRMRRAQEQALSGRRYTSTMDFMLGSLLAQTDPGRHPLLGIKADASTDEGRSTLVLAIGPDKGLCGGLVTNLLREIARLQSVRSGVEFVTMGKRVRQGVRKLGGSIIADVPLRERPRINDVIVMAKIAIDGFTSGKYDQVVIANTRFVTTLKQQPQIVPLLPLSTEVANERLNALGPKEREEESDIPEFKFEPDVDTVLKQLLPRYVEMTVYEALLEALASEYSARMIAMKNAGDNARELQQELNLTYNQLRQASITAELAEIAGGSY